MIPLTVLIIGSLYRPEEQTLPPGLGASTLALQEDSETARKSKLKAAQKEYDEEHKPRFEEACRALGAAFARKHWHIMVGTPEWEQLTSRQTVARFVVEGANREKPDKATGKHHVVFYAPREPEVFPEKGTVETPQKPEVSPKERAVRALQQLEVDNPNVMLDYKLIAQGQYKAKVIPNLLEVDAVVLVRGSDGTASIGYAAHCLNRPVVAVAGFGGAAWTLLQDVLFNEYDRYKEAVQLTDGELLSLTASWSKEPKDAANRANADNIVTTAEKLVKAYSLADRITSRVLKRAMMGMALLLCLWVTIYLRGAEVSMKATAAATAASGEQVPGTPTATTKPVAPAASKSVASTTDAVTAEPAPASATKAENKSAVAAKDDDPVAKSTGAEAKPSTSPNKNEAAGGRGGPGQEGNGIPPPDTKPPWIRFVPVAFFLLLYISTAVGTGLRLLVAFQSNQLTRLTGLAVWIELVVALSVAFGLALFYLIGSISFTGHVTMLKSTSDNFPTIAVTMSLLGLAAGYLVPIDKLRDRLQKIFAEEEK